MCQIFISSEMKHGTLDGERRAARGVVKRMYDLFSPWDWEHESAAGPDTPMTNCLEAVQASFAFIMIVCRTLTDHTEAEYQEALDYGLPVFLFFKKGRQAGRSRIFRESLADSGPTYKTYSSLTELETMIDDALKVYTTKALEHSKSSRMSSSSPTYGGK